MLESLKVELRLKLRVYLMDDPNPESSPNINGAASLNLQPLVDKKGLQNAPDPRTQSLNGSESGASQQLVAGVVGAPRSAKFASCPEALKEEPFVVWRSETLADGRISKVPYNARSTGSKASSTNQETWSTFDKAMWALDNDPTLDGVGIVLHQGNNLACIDLDNKTNDPEVERLHQETIAYFDSYCERSPSGTGWHIWIYSDLEVTGRRKDNIEYYSVGRFMTLTCEVL